MALGRVRPGLKPLIPNPDRVSQLIAWPSPNPTQTWLGPGLAQPEWLLIIEVVKEPFGCISNEMT